MNAPTGRQAMPKPGFGHFYHQVFLPEHRHPVNVALHMAGTIGGLAYVVALLWAPRPWWPALLLFPLVNAAPGLVSHRLMERSAAVGDAHWRRTDHPGWWLMLASPPHDHRRAAALARPRFTVTTLSVGRRCAAQAWAAWRMTAR